MTTMNLPRSGARAAGLLVVLAGLVPHPAAQDDPQAEMKAIETELNRESSELRAALQDAGGPEESQAIFDSYTAEILPEFAERFAAIARAHRSSPVAFEAWSKVLGLANRGMRAPITSEALKALTTDHIDAPELDRIATSLRYGPPAIDEADAIGALRALVAGTPHRKVQAAARYNLAALLGDDRPAGDPRVTEAKEIFQGLAAFDDVVFRDQQSYADAARTFLFALENLAVGRPCPDFDAVDAEGVAFKLSDYKGKVVLVDFWGFW